MAIFLKCMNTCESHFSYHVATFVSVWNILGGTVHFSRILATICLKMIGMQLPHVWLNFIRPIKVDWPSDPNVMIHSDCFLFLDPNEKFPLQRNPRRTEDSLWLYLNQIWLKLTHLLTPRGSKFRTVPLGKFCRSPKKFTLLVPSNTYHTY